ncbi:MAG: hypothetical protein ACJ790_00840 [Myxococcaceae bacterium]
MKKRNLGEILLEMGAIDQLQLNAALAYHRQWGVPLGKALVEKRLCGGDKVFSALAKQSGLPVIKLDQQKLDPRLSSLIPLKVAQQHRVIPLRLEGKRAETLVVAIAAPASLGALDAVQSVTGKQRVVAHLATDEDLGLALSRIYGVENPHAVAAPPAFAPARMADEAEVDLDPQPSRAEESGTVLLYGWPEGPAASLLEMISKSGLGARIIDEAELSHAGAGEVVLAPLPSIEAAAKRGLRAAAPLIVAGKDPDVDFPRAQRVGACGFLPAPVEAELVLHVVRRVTRQMKTRAA